MKIALSATLYAVFAAVVGLFSFWPNYQYVGEHEAIISVAFSHAGQRIGECRRLTQDELNALPPNMRKPNDCPRGRHPVQVELILDGETLLQKALQPSGIWSDGKANAYERLRIAAGPHRLQVRVNDAGGAAEGEITAGAVLDIVPGRNVVVGIEQRQITIR